MPGSTAGSASRRRTCSRPATRSTCTARWCSDPFGLSVHLPDLWGPGQDFTLAGRTLTALPDRGADPARRLLLRAERLAAAQPPAAGPGRDGAVRRATTRPRSSTWPAAGRPRRCSPSHSPRPGSTSGLADVTALTAWAARYHRHSRDERLLALYRRPDAPYAKLALHSLPVLDGWGARAAFTRSLALPDRSSSDTAGASLPGYLWRGTRRALRGTRSMTRVDTRQVATVAGLAAGGRATWAG